jgi:hypothetical protein
LAQTLSPFSEILCVSPFSEVLCNPLPHCTSQNLDQNGAANHSHLRAVGLALKEKISKAALFGLQPSAYHATPPRARAAKLTRVGEGFPARTRDLNFNNNKAGRALQQLAENPIVSMAVAVVHSDAHDRHVLEALKHMVCEC